MKRLFVEDACIREVFEFVEHAQLKGAQFSSAGAPLFNREYALLKQGFPKKDKFERKLGGVIVLC